MRKYLCIVDVLPSGRIAALQVDAVDAIEAEREAGRYGREHFGGPVEVIEVLPNDAPAAV